MNKRLLVVEDDTELRKLIQHALRKEDYEILLAEDGQVALEMFNEFEPTVVLLDLYMPVMSGFKFLEELKPDIDNSYSVVVLTGSTSKEDIKKCYSMGVTTFLHKPCNNIEIREVVKRTFAIKRLEFERKQYIKMLEEKRHALERSEQRLNLIVQSMQAGVVIIDKESNRITQVNPWAEKIINAKREEIIGCDYHKFFPSLGKKFPQLNVKRKLLTDDDQTVTILTSINEVNLHGQRHLVESFVDISEHEEEARIGIVKASEEISNRAKNDFLLKMNKKLRKPVSDLLTMTGNFLEGEIPKSQKEYAETVFSSAGSLLGMLNDIIDLSSIEHGHLKLHSNEIALFDLLEDLRETFSLLSSAKGMDFSLEIDPGTPKKVIADRKRLQQILSSLLENAIEHTERGLIKLRVTTSDRSGHKTCLILSVKDDGAGIPKEEQDRIFGKFSQLDPLFASADNGVGLGLSLAKSLAKLMGGDLTLESEVGHGSDFTLNVPVEIA